jgi:hypothetical protein
MLSVAVIGYDRKNYMMFKVSLRHIRAIIPGPAACWLIVYEGIANDVSFASNSYWIVPGTYEELF